MTSSTTAGPGPINTHFVCDNTRESVVHFFGRADATPRVTTIQRGPFLPAGWLAAQLA
jgi:hypothetical protein